jgi:hypothetical protein
MNGDWFMTLPKKSSITVADDTIDRVGSSANTVDVRYRPVAGTLRKYTKGDAETSCTWLLVSYNSAKGIGVQR